MAEYRYQKICKLSRCHKVFGTNRDWQLFCERDHALEYNQKEIKDAKALSKRVSDLEREIHNKRR